MSEPPGLEEACEEIVTLQQEVNRLTLLVRKLDGEVRASLAALEYGAEELDTLRVQVAFWKRACEQALDGWNKLEDEINADPSRL